jgi:hypothetical protein
MAACERCWTDSRMRALTHDGAYYAEMADKEARGIVCTPEEQCGDLHVLCLDNDTRCRCGKRTAEGSPVNGAT